jgi:SAM-dependent methyltransferase
MERICDQLVNCIRKNVPDFSETTHFCPICSYLGKFDASGPDNASPNSKCPKCGSNGRARLYYLYLMDMRLGETPAKVLHVMPEQSIRYKINHAENIDYHISDLNDISPLTYPDDSFDLIMANYIIHRVQNDVDVLKEIGRVLKDTGRAMVSVHMREGSSDLSSTPRRYGSDYPDRVAGCGFNVEVVDAIKLVGKPMSVLCAIPDYEKIVLMKRS